jgi:hypothetical protein
MSIVVGVHGIAQQLKTARDLEQEWEAPVRDGVLAAGKELEEGAFRCAFYGRVFRGEPHYRASDITADEAELLMLLWSEAARAEPWRVAAPDVALGVQGALRELLGTRYFATLTEAELISDVKQVPPKLLYVQCRHELIGEHDWSRGHAIDTEAAMHPPIRIGQQHFQEFVCRQTQTSR